MNNKHQNCLICHSSDIALYGKYLNNGLLKCNDCGFFFAQQIPTVEELIAHYEGYGRNDYLSPVTISRYNEILDSFEPYRKTNKLIDVGCGIGFFLDVAKQRGWDVYGTEYTDEAIKICREKGFTMHQGPLNTDNYPLESFDVITSFEVMEHINNPIEEVNKFNKLLRKDGLFYFTTPNFNALERMYLKEHYSVVVYPEHLSYYTKKTAQRLLENNGFKKLKMATTGFSISLINSRKEDVSVQYVAENNTDDKIRNLTESNPIAKVGKGLVNTCLDLLGVGNSLKGYFIKK
jgi:2-polyprenyl-3-methyl-5-hydroxy-6-metoxy-1,4-benzoquinol methylase